MPRRAKPLTAARVRTAPPGRYGDGDGLYLLVRDSGARSWLFRYVRNGRMREMGLGSAGPGLAAVTLHEARVKAAALMRVVRDGADPLAQREIDRAVEAAEAQAAAIRGITFKAVAEHYIEAHAAGWSNVKHAAQWSATLETYAYPHFGEMPAATIETAEVLAALTPIWTTKPETASRVRGRIESILDYARVRGWRTGDNPARWRGHLDHLLPTRSRVQKVEHHAALPWREIGAFMVSLRKQEGIAARALEFAILTAARTGEVLGASWGEIDNTTKMWTIPAERMKAGKEHRVPLCKRALAILAEMAPLKADDSPATFVFPGQRTRRPLSNMAFLMLLRRMNRGDLTAHGFRSTFRDWAAESTSFPREVAEMALAHTLGDKVEAAYRRGDLLEKRTRLMTAWAAFCDGETVENADPPRPPALAE